MNHILTELNNSICFTAAAAAADAWAFFLLDAADTIGTAAVAVEVADESVGGAAEESELQGAPPPEKVIAPPTPVAEALDLLEFVLRTVEDPLLLITWDFSPAVPVLFAAPLPDSPSASREEKEAGTNAEEAVVKEGAVEGFKITFGSDRIWLISTSSCSNRIFAAAIWMCLSC